jgi:hypothetical protein
MTYREVARKLAALGCREIPRKGSGSHRKWHNPAARLLREQGLPVPPSSSDPTVTIRNAPRRQVIHVGGDGFDS